jgi:hypothetical protein
LRQKPRLIEASAVFLGGVVDLQSTLPLNLAIRPVNWNVASGDESTRLRDDSAIALD